MVFKQIYHETKIVNIGNKKYGVHKVYIDITNGSNLYTVYGDTNNNLKINIKNNGKFYKNKVGGLTSNMQNTKLLSIYPELNWNSYITIGNTTNVNNNLNIIGFRGQENNFYNGNLTLVNGGWFINKDDIQGKEENGKVLIMQLTTIMLTPTTFNPINIVLNIKWRY